MHHKSASAMQELVRGLLKHVQAIKGVPGSFADLLLNLRDCKTGALLPGWLVPVLPVVMTDHYQDPRPVGTCSSVLSVPQIGVQTRQVNGLEAARKALRLCFDALDAH